MLTVIDKNNKEDILCNNTTTADIGYQIND